MYYWLRFRPAKMNSFSFFLSFFFFFFFWGGGGWGEGGLLGLLCAFKS